MNWLDLLALGSAIFLVTGAMVYIWRAATLCKTTQKGGEKHDNITTS
jgi:hypothetical protein